MYSGSINELTKGGCNIAQKDKVCRARGGESCAFDGAMIALQPLADCVHLVHGPIACCGNSWESRGSLSVHGDLHKGGFTTALSELDIVYGAEDKLLRAIRESVSAVRPKAVFVYATCVSGLTGEDIEAVCKRAEQELSISVIPVIAPGFVGPKNLGNRIAGETLLKYVIGRGEPNFEVSRRHINLIGEFNIAGDLNYIEPLLEDIGVKVLSRITGNGTYEEITYAHRASLNVLVCSRALINIAKTMKARYGIPYIEVSFFGNTETSDALRAIASSLGIADHIVEEVISNKEKMLSERLKGYTSLRGLKALLYSGGVKSWSLISALRDLGIETVAVGVKKSSYEDEEKARDRLSPDAEVFTDTSYKNIMRIYRQKGAHMMIAGSRNIFIAIKEGLPYVDVNQERHIAFAGYEGLVRLAHHIDASIRFYSKEREAISPTIEDSPKAIDIDPLGHAPSIGAIIAMQGFDRTMPILHSAQGCGFLAKALISRHFREPIALATSRLFTEDVVMGSEEALMKVIEETLTRQRPKMIAVITTALTEVKGDDVTSTFKRVDAASQGCLLIHISAPDYAGSIEEGYRFALESVIRAVLPKSQSQSLKGQINVVAPSWMTPADFSELKGILEAFGLRGIVIPDLSCLEGSRRYFSPLATEGVGIERLYSICQSELTIVIGRGLEPIAQLIESHAGVPYVVLDGLGCLADTDRLYEVLSGLCDGAVPSQVIRMRDIAINTMRKAHFYLSPIKVALALETDHSISLSRLLEEMAVAIELSVVPHLTERTEQIKAMTVKVGTFQDISSAFDLLISNSHGVRRASASGVAHYQTGFPSDKVIGYGSRISIGYRGIIQTINDMTNALLNKRQEV